MSRWFYMLQIYVLYVYIFNCRMLCVHQSPPPPHTPPGMLRCEALFCCHHDIREDSSFNLDPWCKWYINPLYIEGANPHPGCTRDET